MEIKNLEQMKASEIHKIVAAVLEIVEEADFDPQVDVKLQEQEEGVWLMDFIKKETSLNELNSIKDKLGKNFSVKVSTKDAKRLLVSVAAPAQDFISLMLPVR